METKDIVIGVLIILLIFVVYLWYARGERIKELDVELAKIKAELETKKKEVDELNTAKQLLLNDKSKTAEEYKKLTELKNQFEQNNAAMNSRIASLNQQIEASTTKVEYNKLLAEKTGLEQKRIADLAEQQRTLTEARATALSEQRAPLDAEIARLNKALSDRDTSIQNLQSKLNYYGRLVTGIKSALKAVASNTLDIKIDAASENVEDFNGIIGVISDTLQEKLTEVESLKSKLAQVSGLSVTTGPEYAALQKLLTDNNSFVEIQRKLDEMQRNLAAKTNELTTMTADRDTQRQNLATRTNELATMTTDRDTQRQNLATRTNELKIMTEDRDMQRQNLATSNSLINKLKEMIDVINDRLWRASDLTNFTVNNNSSLIIPAADANNVFANSNNPSNVVPKIDELVTYIRTTKAVFDKVLEITKRSFPEISTAGAITNYGGITEIMGRYENEVNKLRFELSKYVKTGNRIPINFLRNTYLYEVDINNERPTNLQGANWSIPYPANVRTGAPKDCNASDYCSSFTFSGNYASMPVRIAYRDIHQNDAGGEWTFLKDGTNEEIPSDAKITSVVLARVYNADRPTDTNFYRNLFDNPNGSTFNPNSLIGKRSIRLSSINAGDPLPGVWKRYLIKVVYTSLGDNWAVNPTNDSEVLYNAGYWDGSKLLKSNLYKNSSYAVMISKPNLINWDNYGYSGANDTVDLSLLNNNTTGSNGIYFRNTGILDGAPEPSGPHYVGSFGECLQKLNENPTGQSIIMGRNPDKDNNGKFYCSVRGNNTTPPTLTRRWGASLPYDVYIKPGANVNFEF